MESSDKFYTKYSRFYNSYSTGKEPFLSAVDKFVFDSLCSIDKVDSSIIDIGCGNGVRGKSIADKLNIKKILGIDNSKGMIDAAQKIPGLETCLIDISDKSIEFDEKYNICLFLSNVLSHIPTEKRRLIMLKNIYDFTSDDGVLFIDVNNRYNIANYGYKSVLKNIFKDIFLPHKVNGDFNLKVKIPGEIISTGVHIFSPFEIQRLLKLSGFKILDRKIVDYKTGQIRKSVFCGQLLYRLTK